MNQKNTSFIQPHILKRFSIMKKVGSGAYGHVWKVEDKASRKIYALKKIFDAFQHATDAQRTYRQIEILHQINHPNIIKLYQTINAESNKDVYLIFQFMEADLHNVIIEGILKDVHTKFIIYQIAKALKYLHSGFIIHRDLKPSNILINSNCTIKLCDFGLVRSILNINDNNPVLTEGVATRWYRAPQILLGSKSYSTPADLWSFGCIIYQVLAKKPLFPGNSTLEQLQKIISFTGFPSQEDILSLESEMAKAMIKQIKPNTIYNHSKFTLKDIPTQFHDLLTQILTFNPNKRITIDQILKLELVKPYRKETQEIICKHQLKTSIDDNKKLTVDEYRKLVYKNRKSILNNPSVPSLTKTHSSKVIHDKSAYDSTKNSIKNDNQLLKNKSQIISITNHKNNMNQSIQSKNQNPQNYKHNFKNVKSFKDLKSDQSQKSQKISIKKIQSNHKFDKFQQKLKTNADISKQITKTKNTIHNNFYTPKSIIQTKKTSINCCPWGSFKAVNNDNKLKIDNSSFAINKFEEAEKNT